MANWTPVQNSFHVGEVSARISMRQDIEQYKQAVAKMLNWMTNPQGTVERVPGSRYLDTINTGANPRGRIIAFKDANEVDALLIMQPSGIEVRSNVDVSGSLSIRAAASPTENIVLNPSFREGDEYWDYTALITQDDPTAPSTGGVFFNTF